MKQHCGDTVKGYDYYGVDDFMGIYHRAKVDYADYIKKVKTWADKYGMKYMEQHFEQQKKCFEPNIKRIKYHSSLS